MYKEEIKKGSWTVDEDIQLISYIALHGEGRWDFLAKSAGLKRSGKSCRMRWVNYLRPDLKRGNITADEERLIIELQSRWGNRWSRIAHHLPGRTDNEIKNHWRTRIKRKLNSGDRSLVQHSINSTSIPDQFLQQNSGAEMDWTPQSNLQQSLILNNTVARYDEHPKEEFAMVPSDSIRMSNRVNKFEENSEVSEGMVMPLEMESFADMLSELYADLREDGTVSIPSFMAWPQDLVH